MTKLSQSPIFLIRNITGYGGAEIYQVEVAKILKQEGLNPIIITNEPKLQQIAKKHHIKLINGRYCKQQNWSGYRNLFLPVYIIWQIRLYFWYKKLFKKYQPQAVHIQSRDDMIAGTLAAKKLGIRVIWTDHTDFRLVIWENVNQKFKQPIGKFILKLAPGVDKITTVSNYEYQYVTKLIAPRKLSNFIVVQNGVIDQYDQYKKTKPQLDIAYIGRIIDYKGIGELIDAFNQIKTNTRLHLYGTGPDLDHYQKLASPNPNIIFHGHTTEPLRAIAQSQIFVLPSYHEGLSLSLLEAAMMQRAIIATNIDGNPEVVIDQDTGLLVPVKNPQKLAAAIQKLLSDEKLRQKLAKSARELYRKQFNFDTIVKEKIIPLYTGDSSHVTK